MYYGTLYHADHDRLKELSRSQILVYSSLISHGGKDRTFTGSQSKLANIAGVSLGSVKRALKHFEEQGWLTTQDFYQVKKYMMVNPSMEEDKSDPEIVQDCDPVIVQSYELPENESVDQSYEPPIGQDCDLPIGQDCDPHIRKNKKEITNLHCTVAPEIKRTFQNFFHRWQTVKGWKMDRDLEDVWNLFVETPNVNHELELKVVDSWLMLQHYNQNGRCWSFGWFDRLSRWFKSENESGGRTHLRLNKQQQYFLNFAVTDTTIPTPPIFEESQMAVKVAQGDNRPHLQVVEPEPETEDFGFDDILEAAKNSPTLQKILKEQGIL